MNMVRENKTIEVMIRMYCRSHHSKDDTLCEDCQELLKYAGSRLQECPFGESKPTCAKCPVHCYRPSMRTKITSVMKYSGPRLLSEHPILALRHLTTCSLMPFKRGRM